MTSSSRSRSSSLRPHHLDPTSLHSRPSTAPPPPPPQHNPTAANRFPAKLVHFVVFSSRLPSILSSAASIAAKSQTSGSPSRYSFSAGDEESAFEQDNATEPNAQEVEEDKLKDNEILYFYPPNQANANESFVAVNDQSKYVGLYKGLIEFTRTFKADGEVETVHSRKHRVVFEEVENDLWMVLVS
jgi:hypothetical protein